ncbi:MAG: tetratricopeptide repeat protein [Bacteroidetes bacterium]|nr:tetratricopeptide repeat protein [Bacteroidota bacterium]
MRKRYQREKIKSKVIKSFVVLLIYMPLLMAQDYQAQYDSASTLFKNGNINTSIVILNNLIESHPENVDAYYALGALYLDKNLYSDAKKLFSRGLVIEETNDIIFGLGVAEFLLGSNTAAEEYFIKLENKDYRPEDVNTFLGQIYLKTNRPSKSYSYFNKIIEINPLNENALTNLGVISYNIGDVDKAEDYFEKALHVNPDNEGAYMNIGAFYSSIDKFNDAIYYLNMGMEINPKNEKLHNTLGATYMSRGIYAEAITHFRAAISLNEEYTEPYYNLMLAYFQMSEFFKALQYSEILAQIKFDYPEYHLLLSQIHLKLKEYDKAMDEALIEYEIYPDRIEVQNYVTRLKKYLDSVQFIDAQLDRPKNKPDR